MACGSGCCGPPTPPQLPTLTNQPTPVTDSGNDNDSCHDGAAADTGGNGKDESCLASTSPSLNEKPAPDGCQSGCCDSQAEKPVQVAEAAAKTAGEDTCCSASAEDCCGPSPPSKSASDKAGPDCCDGTTAPCCDDSCLDRLALRACETGKKPVILVESYEVSSASSSRPASKCGGVEDGKSCGYHKRITRDTYATTLSALGCICRALLALGQESCCAPKERSSIDRKRSSKRSSCHSSIMTRPSVDSCCAPKARPQTKKGGCCGPAEPSGSRSQASGGCCAAGPSNVDAAKGEGLSTGFSHGRAPRSRARSPAGSSCGESCELDDLTPAPPIERGPGNLNKFSSETDLEKGITELEHVVLSVAGMTCTGCENKLKKNLRSLRQVKNLKTSLVLSRAEYDIDRTYGTREDVLKHLQRTCEFRCEEVSKQDSGIDLLVPGDASQFMEQQWPQGVTNITMVDKKTVRVAHDPNIVGARDLVEKGWENPLRLAPLRPDPMLMTGKDVRHLGYITLLSTILTIPVLIMAWAPLPDADIAYGSASLALATIVQVAVAGRFYPKAFKSLVFSRVVEMDLLIVLSTTAAYVFSVVAYVYMVLDRELETGQFFETSTLLVTLIMLGRWVAALARHKAVESISFRSLQSSSTIIVDSHGKNEREIDTRLLQHGDFFKVVPDSRIPTDGTVMSGTSEVDESMITGESHPVEKKRKSTVIAGTLNGSGTLIVRLNRLPGSNTITTIAGLVDEAKLTKPKIQDLADQVASFFVPVIVSIAAVTFAAWLVAGVRDMGLSGSNAAIRAVTYAITVLIVSCPCAIGLAVPMVIVIGTGVAAKHGVVFKTAGSIEVAHKAKHVVFDKTGTLTQGKLAVASVDYVGEGDPNTVASLLLGLVSGIKHPVSAAIAAHLTAKTVSPATVSEVKALAGKGVEGISDSGLMLRAGNSRWLRTSSHPLVEATLAKSCTAFCFTIDGNLVAVFGLKDSVRDGALETVTKLQNRGISVHLISGDDDGVVRTLGKELGIHDANIRSRCTPADKKDYVSDLLMPVPQKASWLASRFSSGIPVVIFCGDGTNDAVALTQATVGVAIQHADDSSGIGADVAKSAADAVLVTPRLSGILTLITVSKLSVNRIWFNFGWSFVYNLFAILLGAGAFASYGNVRIPPQYAGLGEIVSVLPVIGAAVQLRFVKV